MEQAFNPVTVFPQGLSTDGDGISLSSLHELLLQPFHRSAASLPARIGDQRRFFENWQRVICLPDSLHIKKDLAAKPHMNAMSAQEEINEAEQEEEVFQLLYISAATQEFTEEELADLLDKARVNNEEQGVSGMLLFHEGSFIQALEGSEQAVDGIYKKISKDPRHMETRVLFRGHKSQRDFEGWSMGFYRSRQSSKENLEGFHHFLATGFRRNADNDDSKARKALLAFREGKWRTVVET